MALASPDNWLDPSWTQDELRASFSLLAALAHHALDVDDVARAAHTSLCQSLGADGGCVFLVHPHARLAYQDHLSPALVEQLDKISPPPGSDFLADVQNLFAQHNLPCLAIALTTPTHLLGTVTLVAPTRSFSANWRAQAGKWIGSTFFNTHTHQALSENNAHLSAFIENNTHAFWEGDFDGNIFYANDAACRILEMSREQLLGMNSRQLDQDQGLGLTAQHELTEHSAMTNQLRHLRTGTGKSITVNYSSRIIQSPPKSAPRYQAIFRDVTEQTHVLETLERRNRELTVLNQIATILSQPSELSQMLPQVCQQVASLIGMETVVVYLINPTQTHLDLVAQQGVDSALLKHIQQLGLDDPATWRIAIAGIPFATEDVIQHAGSGFAGPRAEGYHAGIGVQIRKRGKPAGAIFAGSKSATHYSQQDIAFLNTVANHVGIALENTALYEQMQQRLAVLEGLAQLSTRLIATVNTQTIFDVTLQYLKTLFEVDVCNIRTLENQALHLRAAYTRIDGIELAQSVPLNDQMRAVLMQRQTVAIYDAATDVSAFPQMQNQLKARGLRAMLVAPFTAPNHSIGMLVLLHTHTRRWRRDEIDLLQTIANQVGIAIEKHNLLEQTRQRVAELEGLAQLSVACTLNLEPQTIFQSTLYWTQTLLQSDAADLRQLNGDQLEPIPNGTRGLDLRINMPLMLNELAHLFKVRREPLILHNAQNTPQLPPETLKLLSERHIHSILAMPLVARDKVIGVLSAVQTTPRVWAEHEVELLHTIANQAANAIYNAQLFQQVVAEQRQNKAIIESGLNGIYVTDRTGRISMFNHAAIVMTGWREQEAIGAQWEDIFADVNASATPSLIQRVITTQRPINSISGRVIRQRHGAPIPILEAASPLLDENGAVTGVVGTIWDLTRERQAELERADLLEFFTHELRTPISNLVSIAQMLDSPRVEKANRAELLALIKKEGRRLRKFADDFLHRNGAFAPAEPVKLTRLNIKTIVNKTVQRFRADDHTHYFRIKSPRPLPLVWATREHVEHILDNLLENAVNYSPDDTRITISIETDPEYVTVAVHDQGKGIPVGEHELIFHRYYRAKNSRGRIAGHGLGLAIVRKMVTEMGGKIWVESRPHHGATFRFTLRRQK